MFCKSLCLEIANYFINNKSTIRKTAAHFGVSKSSVHNYIHKRLKKINYSLFLKAQELLDKNNLEKHIRGGMATKEKFKQNKV